MGVELGALVIFATHMDEVVSFYRALGVPLEDETHEDGPVHQACDLGAVHFAVFPSGADAGPGSRSGRAVMPGFAVPSLGDALKHVRALGSEIVEEPTEYPWGPRFLVRDPDGRTVEVFERRGAGAV